MGSNIELPGSPAKTIQLDNNPYAFDENVYNIDTFNRFVVGIETIIPGYAELLSEYSYLFDLYTKYDDENSN